MKCTDAKSLLSQYLDGAVTGSQMHSISTHLGECPPCRGDYTHLRGTQLLLASLGRRQAPPELALQIRVAISRERSQTLGRRLRSLGDRAEEKLNAFLMPATAGLVSAVLMFAILIGGLWPMHLTALNNDVPTSLFIPPRITGSAVVGSFAAGSDEAPILVETYIDQHGRVQDYRIIAGEDTDAVRTELNRTLIFTVFEPAVMLGRRVPSRVVLTFANVNVRG